MLISRDLKIGDVVSDMFTFNNIKVTKENINLILMSNGLYGNTGMDYYILRKSGFKIITKAILSLPCGFRIRSLGKKWVYYTNKKDYVEIKNLNQLSFIYKVIKGKELEIIL